MHEIEVEHVFSAAHALVVRGVREALHGHDWRVTVTVRSPALDADGLVCDFHGLARALREAVAPWEHGNLNEAEPFRSGVNPSAERVAEEIARRVAGAVEPPARVWAVRVTESPGCAARYVAGGGVDAG